ncbi:cupin domain-containing protein [Bowmanella dokdonensis]|uniref:Cupin domain-containing protein n=1 Tax=Bowmanella dokdonensis TaxID=751969 RepID=A0A939IQ18_9ALTE|nr:cupin domain-containing protein [Bowmanella dokdonensis]MBN7826455.1 cupin domain-containing protein [Bowmanella dokdonensis]
MPNLTANINEHFIVLDGNKNASTVPVGPTLYQDLDRDFAGFKGCELIAQYEFTSNWQSWEIHPQGDEIVMLLSGRVTLLLDRPQGEQKIPLSQPGDYVIVPKNTWHTAHTDTPTRLLFITPGQDTGHKPA